MPCSGGVSPSPLVPVSCPVRCQHPHTSQPSVEEPKLPKTQCSPGTFPRVPTARARAAEPEFPPWWEEADLSPSCVPHPSAPISGAHKGSRHGGAASSRSCPGAHVDRSEERREKQSCDKNKINHSYTPGSLLNTSRPGLLLSLLPCGATMVSPP